MPADTDAAAFDSAYYEANHQNRDRPALRMYARVAKRLTPAGSVALDFGSGAGHFVRRLSATYQTIACDVSEHARESTRSISPHTRTVSALSDVAVDSVDMGCALHVLEHVPDPSTALEELARVIRPGGVLLYVVPNPDGWGHRLKGSEWFAYKDPSHCALLGAAEWISRTRAAGFEIESTTSDGLWDPPYFTRVPKVLQFVTIGAGAALSVVLSRTFLPRNWGECLVVTARRRPSTCRPQRPC